MLYLRQLYIITHDIPGIIVCITQVIMYYTQDITEITHMLYGKELYYKLVTREITH